MNDVTRVCTMKDVIKHDFKPLDIEHRRKMEKGGEYAEDVDTGQ